MFANLSDIVKIPLAVLAGIAVTVLFYEGVRLPIVGQIVPGIVWYRADAVKSTMVTVFERDALKAQLEAERRYSQSATAAAVEANKRALETQKAKEEADAKVEALSAAAKQDGLEGWSEKELEWLGKH